MYPYFVLSGNPESWFGYREHAKAVNHFFYKMLPPLGRAGNTRR